MNADERMDDMNADDTSTVGEMEYGRAQSITWGEAARLGLTVETIIAWGVDLGKRIVVELGDRDKFIYMRGGGCPLELFAIVKFGCPCCQHIHADALVMRQGDPINPGSSSGPFMAWCDECVGPVEIKEIEW